MSTCDYCCLYPTPARWLAAAQTADSGMLRLACQGHLDQARVDCSAVAPPTITAVPADRPWTLGATKESAA